MPCSTAYDVRRSTAVDLAVLLPLGSSTARKGWVPINRVRTTGVRNFLDEICSTAARVGTGGRFLLWLVASTMEGGGAGGVVCFLPRRACRSWQGSMEGLIVREHLGQRRLGIYE